MKNNIRKIIALILVYLFINNLNATNYIPEDLPKSDSIVTQIATKDTTKVVIKEKNAAYETKSITVIQLYWTDEFNLKEVREVLASQGYTITGWKEEAPSVKDLKAALDKSNQLWIISDDIQKLTAEHLKVIKDFFNQGHGVYLLGDNADYYMDANYVSKALVGATLLGEYDGEKLITFPKKNSQFKNNQNKTQNSQGQAQGRNNQNQGRNNQYGNQNHGTNNQYGSQNMQPGKLLVHDITDSLQHLYEGITVSGVDTLANDMNPVVIGSNNEVLIGVYDKNEKRLVLDGGFTRLYCSWDNETSKFVQNVTLWLSNAERFDTKNKAVTTISTVVEEITSYRQIVTESQATPE